LTRRWTCGLPGTKGVSELQAFTIIVWLPLFIAVLIAWGLSYDWAVYKLYDRDSQSEWVLHRGALIQFRGTTYTPPPTERFRLTKTVAYDVEQGGRIVVRMWELAAILLLLGPGLLWLLKWYRSRKYERRVAHRLCVNCGYDLRGQTVPRCPECAQPFPAPEDEGERQHASQ
jgi:hypothetical protein